MSMRARVVTIVAVAPRALWEVPHPLEKPEVVPIAGLATDDLERGRGVR